MSVKNIHRMLLFPPNLLVVPGKVSRQAAELRRVKSKLGVEPGKIKVSEAFSDFPPPVLLLWEGVRHCDGDTGKVERWDEDCFKVLVDEQN